MMPKKARPKKKRAGISARKVEKYLPAADKRGERDPQHYWEFDILLDALPRYDNG